MGEVKRYDSYGYDGMSGLMKEHADGDWVRAEDYDALRAENAELVAALKLCKLNVIELCQTHGYPLPEYTLELTDKALAKHRGYATQPIDKP